MSSKWSSVDYCKFGAKLRSKMTQISRICQALCFLMCYTGWGNDWWSTALPQAFSWGISSGVNEGSSEVTDGSLGRRCLQYCVTETDAVVRHLPRREIFLATLPLGATAIISVTEMSYSVKVYTFKIAFFLLGDKSPGTLRAPQAVFPLSLLGFHID